MSAYTVKYTDRGREITDTINYRADRPEPEAVLGNVRYTVVASEEKNPTSYWTFEFTFSFQPYPHSTHLVEIMSFLDNGLAMDLTSITVG